MANNTLKHIFALLFIALFFPAAAFADTHEAASCENTAGQLDVQTAINASSTGDTVTIPAGSCTWTTTVSIPSGKNITLQGAGATSTVISTSTIAALSLVSNASRITAMGFVCTGALTGQINISAGTGWRIDHCKFTNNYGSSRVIIWVHDSYSAQAISTGLIDNNEFIDARLIIDNCSNITEARAYWFAENKHGTTNNVYIEDNTFTRSYTSNIIDAENYCGSYVARYNTVTATTTGDTNMQVHPPASSSTRGPNNWEMYGNSFTKEGTEGWALFFIRSGTGFNFYNYGTNFGTAIAFDSWGSYATRTGYGFCNGGSAADGNEAITGLETNSAGNSLYGGSGSGTHSGGNNEAVLTDSTKTWNASSMVYSSAVRPYTTLYNVTDGSSCVVTANTSNTVTCTLAGGTDNDWDTGDTYKISNGYPCRDQIGIGKDSVLATTESPYPVQTKTPAYTWANRYASGSLGITEHNGSNGVVEEDRDYYKPPAGAFDGTSGVGCGALGSRSATCTTGVAYWATTQSCTDLTDYVGETPTTTISGTLYKCTATDTWTAHHVSYQYPHPLRGEGTSYTLAITKSGDGDGRLYSTSLDVDLPVDTASDSGPVQTGTVVILKATEYTGMGDFIGWTGDCLSCGANLECVKTITAATSCDGEFSFDPEETSYPLALTKSGPGTGLVTGSPAGINCGGTCSYDYLENTEVTLTATADNPWTFGGWSGAGCSGTGTCVVTMSEAKNANAIFSGKAAWAAP